MLFYPACLPQLVSYLHAGSLGMRFAVLPGWVVGPILGWRIKPCLSLMWVGVAHIARMDAG